MKQIYLIAIFSLLSVAINAQITWTGGGGDSNFHNPANWEEGEFPLVDGIMSVIIPEGHTVINSQELVWNQGTIQGPGTFINNGDLLLSSNSNTYYNHSFTSDLVFENNGNMVLDYIDDAFTSGQLNINESVTFTNSSTGIIEFRDFGIAGPTSRIINNGGTIIKTGEADVWAMIRLTNNDGLVDIQEGILNLSHYLYPDTNFFHNGIYNVGEGATFELSSDTKITGTLSGNNEGEWYGATDYICSDSATLDFSGNGITLTFGELRGGGTITNNNVFNFAQTGSSTYKSVLDSTTLINHGEINFIEANSSWGGYNITLHQGAQLINEADGVINFDYFSIYTVNSNLGYFVNNSGVINTNTSSSSIILNCPTELNGGELNIENGVFSLRTPTTSYFEDLTLNIAEDTEVRIQDSTYLEGNFQGTNNGELLLIGISIIEDELSNNIEGNGMAMPNGTIQGDGTINNYTKFSFYNQVWKILKDSLQIRNYGALDIDNTSFTLSFRDATSIINEESGTILLHDGGHISTVENTGSLTNNGLILMDETSSVFIQMPTENHGIMDVGVGGIQIRDFPFVNHTTGRVTGSGTFRVDDWSSSVNNGTFSPGPESQVLISTLGYAQGNQGVLEIDINGAVAGEEYDQLKVNSGATEFSGDILVNLNYAPELDTEFIILDCFSGVTCTEVPETVQTTFEDGTYVFEVLCNDDNITLRLLSVGISELQLEEEYVLFPNPFSSVATLKLNQPIRTENAKIMLRNSLGMEVKEFKIATGASLIEIDRAGLENGIYYVSLISENEVLLSQKLVVN